MATTLDEYGHRTRTVADALAGAQHALGRIGAGPSGFGGGTPGRLGELADDLYRQWSAALTARQREAAAHGVRLADLSDTVRLVAANVRDADGAAAGRHRREG